MKPTPPRTTKAQNIKTTNPQDALDAFNTICFSASVTTMWQQTTYCSVKAEPSSCCKARCGKVRLPTIGNIFLFCKLFRLILALTKLP